jgi:hypothetical protein
VTEEKHAGICESKNGGARIITLVPRIMTFNSDDEGKSVKPRIRVKYYQKASLGLTNKQSNTQKTKNERVSSRDHSPFLFRICLILEFTYRYLCYSILYVC